MAMKGLTLRSCRTCRTIGLRVIRSTLNPDSPVEKYSEPGPPTEAHRTWRHLPVRTVLVDAAPAHHGPGFCRRCGLHVGCCDGVSWQAGPVHHSGVGTGRCVCGPHPPP